MDRPLDVLFVTPPSRLAVYQQLGNELAATEPPVWSSLLANAVRRKGYGVAILDAEALGLGHAETAERILAANARLTVYAIYGQQPSASTQCMPGGRATAALVAEGGDRPSLVLGTHPSALPERTLHEEPYTWVCEGEGLATILGLLRGDRHDAVPGLWWRDPDGAIRHNPPAAVMADLDSALPGQAWDLLDVPRYRAHNWHCFDDLDRRQPYASLQTSLGCPYRCTFCCINAPFGGNSIRFWSPEHVVREIDHLVERFGVRNIKIPDEMFVLNKRHVLGICDLLIERGHDLNIWAYARIDTVHDAFLAKLRRAGFTWLGLGIESGSRHVRDGVEKGRFGDEDVRSAVERVRGHGIHVGANYIFGLPDETHASMQQTLDLACDLNTEWANLYCAMAYPGSPLYGVAKRHGWALPDDPGGPGWIGYSQHAYEALPLPTEHLAATEVLEFRDRAFDVYFGRPEYRAMLGRTFGAGAVAHVEAMTAHRLQRRHHDATRRRSRASVPQYLLTA